MVAISLLADMGNNAAAIAANILLQHCPATRHLIMCGIAGAVPNPDKCDDHVRLGDIVVSSGAGIIQYDRGKQRDPRRAAVTETGHSPDPLAGFELRSQPRAPSPELLGAIQRMHAEEHLLGRNDCRDWEVGIRGFLERCSDPQKWSRPYHSKDRLVDSADGKGPTTKHPPDSERRKIDGVRYPRVFRGAIGTANIVQGDPARRNALRDAHGVKAIEMEGSGVADAAWIAGVGYLVVRGTCDYCNAAKADAWHNYAALIAACYARVVIEYTYPHVHLPVDSIQSHVQQPTVTTLKSDVARAQREPDAAMPHNAWSSDAATNVDASDAKSHDALVAPAPAGIALDLGPANAVAPRDETPFPATAIDLAATKDALTELVSQISDLLREGRWLEAVPLGNDLHNRLRVLPRKGSVVRQGWTTLAQLEDRRLREQKQRNQQVDVSRFRALRKEAEDVID